MKIPRPFVTALPSAVTSLRFFGLPFLVGYIRKEDYLFALVLFAALALTDFIDGVVARWLNAVSRFGKFFDPTADKFLLLPALFYAMRPGFIFHFTLLLYFEAMLFLAACIAFIWPGNPFIKLGANGFGKAKAILEIVLVALFLFSRLGIPIHPEILALGFLLVIIAACLSVCGHITWWRQDKDKQG